MKIALSGAIFQRNLQSRNRLTLLITYVTIIFAILKITRSEIDYWLNNRCSYPPDQILLNIVMGGFQVIYLQTVGHSCAVVPVSREMFKLVGVDTHQDAHGVDDDTPPEH